MALSNPWVLLCCVLEKLWNTSIIFWMDCNTFTKLIIYLMVFMRDENVTGKVNRKIKNLRIDVYDIPHWNGGLLKFTSILNLDGLPFWSGLVFTTATIARMFLFYLTISNNVSLKKGFWLHTLRTHFWESLRSFVVCPFWGLPCFKQLVKMRTMVKFTDVYVNPVWNGILSKLEKWWTLTG